MPAQIKEVLYLLFARIPLCLLGRFRGNLIRTHWGRGLNNFGDCLSPYILKHYGFTPVYVPQRRSQVVLAGTILQWLPKNYRGVILGTGGDDQPYHFPNAFIIGVRGYRTLDNIANHTERGVVGDPGLILDRVFPAQVSKKFRIGIVPHFVDKDHEIIKLWASRFGDHCTVIDVLRSPPKVISDIKSCQYILSSSLHGLIVADAFNIPNARFVIRETMPNDFYDYKFHDYYSSLESFDQVLEADGSESLDELVALTRLHTRAVKKLQQSLDLAFKALPATLASKNRES